MTFSVRSPTAWVKATTSNDALVLAGFDDGAHFDARHALGVVGTSAALLGSLCRCILRVAAPSHCLINVPTRLAHVVLFHCCAFGKRKDLRFGCALILHTRAVCERGPRWRSPLAARWRPSDDGAHFDAWHALGVVGTSAALLGSLCRCILRVAAPSHCLINVPTRSAHVVLFHCCAFGKRKDLRFGCALILHTRAVCERGPRWRSPLAARWRPSDDGAHFDAWRALGVVGTSAALRGSLCRCILRVAAPSHCLSMCQRV
jgi:hypothetical protein